MRPFFSQIHHPTEAPEQKAICFFFFSQVSKLELPSCLSIVNFVWPDAERGLHKLKIPPFLLVSFCLFFAHIYI